MRPWEISHLKDAVFNEVSHGNDPSGHVADGGETRSPPPKMMEVRDVCVFVDNGDGVETGLFLCVRR